ncbi:MAG TPA: hypothetical protein VGF50_11140 [Caulobacteraceae bacterium]
MAQRRRRHLRREVLVFLASTAFHVALFFIAISEFTYYPPPPVAPAPVQLQIVPEAEQPVPPPPIPRIVIKQHLAPTPTPAPPPTPQPQPPTPPKPQPPARVAAQPAPVQSAPLQAKRAPALSPSPKPTLAPSLAPISPAAPAPTPGPPRVIAPAAPTAQSKAFASPHIVLHRNRNEAGAPLAPSVAIPGAVEAAPQQASGAPSGGAPGGPGGGAPGGRGLPGGSLPGFGSGLRGSMLGCANAAALHLSRAEQAKCDEALGTGAHESPVMDAIGATKRAEIDRQAAAEQAAQRYRDSTPSGSEATPIAGQPRIGHRPGDE